jgi:Protein of unknown function (DUF3311)
MRKVAHGERSLGVAQDASSEQRLTREPPSNGGDGRRGVASGETGAKWQWLFLVPFFGTFFPWIYNTRDPELFAIPFFYWYQMIWLPLSVLITIFVYRKTRGRA